MVRANESVDRFAARISKACGCEARVISPAFETDANQPLSVRGPDDPQRRSQMFSVQFTLAAPAAPAR